MQVMMDSQRTVSAHVTRATLRNEMRGPGALRAALTTVPYRSLDLEGTQGKVLLEGATKEAPRKLPQFEYQKQ